MTHHDHRLTPDEARDDALWRHKMRQQDFGVDAGTGKATLPEDCVEATIGAMVIGDEGYTVPWAMRIDYDRNCRLRPGHSLHSTPHGTARMRVALREDGYHVWPCARDKYKPRKPDADDLPIVEVHRDETATPTTYAMVVVVDAEDAEQARSLVTIPTRFVSDPWEVTHVGLGPNADPSRFDTGDCIYQWKEPR